MAAQRSDMVHDMKGPALHPFRLLIVMHDDLDIASDNIVGKEVGRTCKEVSY